MVKKCDEKYFILDGKDNSNFYYCFQKLPEKVINLKAKITIELLDYDYKFNMYRFKMDLNTSEYKAKNKSFYFDISLECILINYTLKAVINYIAILDGNNKKYIAVYNTYKKIENFIKELNIEDEQIIDLTKFNIPFSDISSLDINDSYTETYLEISKTYISISENFISKVSKFIIDKKEE